MFLPSFISGDWTPSSLSINSALNNRHKHLFWGLMCPGGIEVSGPLVVTWRKSALSMAYCRMAGKWKVFKSRCYGLAIRMYLYMEDQPYEVWASYIYYVRISALTARDRETTYYDPLLAMTVSWTMHQCFKQQHQTAELRIWVFNLSIRFLSLIYICPA